LEILLSFSPTTALKIQSRLRNCDGDRLQDVQGDIGGVMDSRSIYREGTLLSYPLRAKPRESIPPFRQVIISMILESFKEPIVSSTGLADVDQLVVSV
jgi:hypothetical protein